MDSRIAHTGRVEGYAIISADGMLADAAGAMPESLKFEADQKFFQDGLDGVDVVVHGRHSHERQPHSHLRRRLIVTRQVSAIAADASQEKTLFWNPAGALLVEALIALGAPDGSIGILGGTDVFALFLDCYDVFYLSRVPGVHLPGGRPIFPGVPARTPEDVLTEHGLSCCQERILDSAAGLAVASWRSLSKRHS